MSVSITEFGKTTAGIPIQRAVLKNDFLEVHLLTYAAVIQKILVPDRKGNPVDVVLGYSTAAAYSLLPSAFSIAVRWENYKPCPAQIQRGRVRQAA